MKKMTIENIREYNPCYDPGRFLPEDWQGTALDILQVTSCPPKDRLWVVTHPGWIDDIVLRQWTQWCALQVVDLWNAPNIVKKYLETGNEELQNVAWDAAWAAAGTAVCDTAWTIASAAACDAAWAIASSAAVTAALSMVTTKNPAASARTIMDNDAIHSENQIVKLIDLIND